MTKDDIIRMAREAGMARLLDEHAHEYGNGRFEYTDYPELETFAALVAAHKTETALAEAYRCGHEAGMVEEREECAKMLEDASKTGKIVSCKSAAAAIRNRGKE